MCPEEHVDVDTCGEEAVLSELFRADITALLPDQLNRQTGTSGPIHPPAISHMHDYTQPYTSSQSVHTWNQIKQLGTNDTTGGRANSMRWGGLEEYREIMKPRQTG